MADDLVVNGRHTATSFAGGVVRYTAELSRELQASEVLVPPTAIASGPLGHVWEQTILPLRSRNQVLLSPANFGPLAHPRHIVTMHDMSPLDHPEWFSPSYVRLFGAVMPALARRAKVVLTDSEFSRQRIAEHCGVDATVASVGVGEPFTTTPERDRGKTVVVVGGRDPRKNVQSILDAWPQVIDRVPEAELIVVGGSRSGWVFGTEEGPTQDQRGVRHVADVDDTALAEMLAEAGAAVFCSLYEGFGLPVLEALATGAPVVCSDIAPLREFADGVATFVDPLAPSDIAAGIIDTLEGETVSPADAKRVAATYSWARVASIIRDAAADL